MDIVQTSDGVFSATIDGQRMHNITAVSRFWSVVQDAIDAGATVTVEEPPTPDPKLVGIEFEGVMCSATGDDQSGLVAVMMAIQLQGEAFQPTRFEFDNGNSLVITTANYQAFMAVWMPFRQSFFAVE